MSSMKKAYNSAKQDLVTGGSPTVWEGEHLVHANVRTPARECAQLLLCKIQYMWRLMTALSEVSALTGWVGFSHSVSQLCDKSAEQKLSDSIGQFRGILTKSQKVDYIDVCDAIKTETPTKTGEAFHSINLKPHLIRKLTLFQQKFN